MRIDRETTDIGELLALLTCLTMNEREAFVDQVIRGEQLGPIAKRMVSKQNPDGISRDRVRKLVKQATRKLETRVRGAA